MKIGGSTRAQAAVCAVFGRWCRASPVGNGGTPPRGDWTRSGADCGEDKADGSRSGSIRVGVGLPAIIGVPCAGRGALLASDVYMYVGIFADVAVALAVIGMVLGKRS